MADLPTGTVTFLFTDIVGSTRLWEQHPEAMRVALARHHTLVSTEIERRGGVVVKKQGEGDSVFAVFARATEAVAAACALQQALLAEHWPQEAPLRVRIALHTGDADLREEDYYGTAVIRCARLRGVAYGGQVLLSLATERLVREALPEGALLRDLGLHHLKDLQQPEHLFQLVHPALPVEFPPLRSLEAFVHSLPRFIGRQRERAEVQRLLSTAALLTLTGAAGCGKTRLALQVAVDALEQYPGGVWLVESAAVADPALVPRTVACALGLAEERDRPLMTTLEDYLGPRSLLLVLDNCEHLLSAWAQLAHHLLRARARLRILASSRERLGIAEETTFRVPPLSLPDLRQPSSVEHLMEFEAPRLFLDRASAAQPSFRLSQSGAAAVDEICHRLDGLPLAIELAAARVKVLSVEQIAARLDDRFRLLTGGSRSAQPRQQTLRALIDWSYDLLDAVEQRLFRRRRVPACGRFAGGCTLVAAAAVCDLNGDLTIDVLEGVSSLAEKSLLRQEEEAEGEPRVMVLETLREYGRERLRANDEEGAVRGRHAEFFLRLAEEAEPGLLGPEQVAWLERLEVEHDNLRAALVWLKEQGLEGEVVRVEGALRRFREIIRSRAEECEPLSAAAPARD